MAKDKALSDMDRLLVAAVLFGGEGDVEDVEFRLKAYLALLDLRDELGDQIEDFDVTAKLEDFAGFRTPKELRHIVESLHLLERHGDGLRRVRERVFLNEFRPGDRDFSRIPSVPADFVRARGQGEDITGRGDIPGALRQALRGCEIVLSTARETGLPFVTPFFRLGRQENDGRQTLESIGAGPATTPLLDLYAFVTAMRSAFPDTVETVDRICVAVEPWFEAYSDRILTADPFGDDGATMLKDDDDYPGADRPTVPTNALLLSALVARQGWLTATGRAVPPDQAAVLRGLVSWLAANQNEDGGWPIYRYRSSRFDGLPREAPSVPLFSFLAIAAMLDALDVDPNMGPAGTEAAKRLAEGVARSAIRLDSGSIGWSFSAARDGHPDLGDTLFTMQACLLVPLLAAETREHMDELVAGAIRFLADHWTLGARDKPDVVRLEFRPPTQEGSAGTPTLWEQAKHARMLSGLCMAYRIRDMLPGPYGVHEMHRAAIRLQDECRNGFWCDVNRENIEKGIINVNTGIISASALLAYEGMARKMRATTERA